MYRFRVLAHVGAVERRACGGGRQVGRELLLEAVEQVVPGERLDGHQVVDHGGREVHRGERRVEGLPPAMRRRQLGDVCRRGAGFSG